MQSNRAQVYLKIPAGLLSKIFNRDRSILSNVYNLFLCFPIKNIGAQIFFLFLPTRSKCEIYIIFCVHFSHFALRKIMNLR